MTTPPPSAQSARPTGGFWFVWRYPALLAVATLAGLLMALLSNGGWLHIACGLVALPVLVCLWCWFKHDKPD